MRGSTTHRFALLAVLLLFGVDTSAAQLLDSTSSDPLPDDVMDVPGAPDLDGTGSILDWAGNLTALPGMTSQGPPVQSHVLGLALPPSLLPARYVADATAQERPLRHALLTWNDALGLQDEAALLADPELERADDLPLDVQVAVAALLYALTDSTLIQAQALEGLDADERALLLSLPDALMTAGDDPQAWVDDPQLSALSEVGSKVDMAPIQDAARIVASTVTHVMPTLEAWSRMEQEEAERMQPRQDDLAEYTDAYSPQRIESMHRIERLDALSEALRMAGDWNGQQVLDLSPIEPASGTTLSDSLRGLAATGSMVLPTPISVDASTLDQADRLPSGLQKAIARIAINQEAWLQSTLDQDPTDPASLARSTTAAVRLVNAVEASAPTIEAFGLLYSHHAYPGIPKLPSDLQQAVPRHVLAADAVARHGTATPALQHAFGSQGATAREVGAPPLPPRGSLEAAVLDLYERYDLGVDDEVRQRLHHDVMALAPTVERNAARMLMVQLDATDMLTGLYQSLTVEELQLISSMAPAHVQNRILEGEVSLHDLQRLEAYYDVVDRVRDGYQEASLTVAAATDASREALADYGSEDMAMDIAPDWGSPILATLNAILPGVQAQSEGEENDILFADPLLGTVVIGGFGRTEYTTTMGGTQADARYGSDTSFSDPNEVHSRLDVTPRGQVLSLDLGGDDLYRSNAGGAFLSFIPSTPQADQQGTGGAAAGWSVQVEAWVDPSTVSVALDMAGDDRYEPPADPESMQNEIGQDVDASQGSLAREAEAQWSTSDAFVMDPRAIQGAGVGGIGLLWDLGGDDQYTAATAAQGFGGGVYDPERPDGVRCTPPAPPLCITGLYGVGMLLDGSGDDRYQAEDLSQGASAPLQVPRVAGDDFVGRTPVGGVGLLVDGDGDDHYLLPQGSRGQGFSDAGVGMLLDGLGDDEYRGGSQGRGLNGGLGVLVDLDGDDDYTQRNDHTNARYRDGTCRARIDPGDPFAGVAPGFGVFADAEGDCSINAFHTLGDVPGADPFALPDQVVAAGEEAQRDVEERVGSLDPPGPEDVLEPPAGFVMAPMCAEGVGVIALGDATPTTYPDPAEAEGACDYLLTIDLGGNDTYRNSVGGPLEGLVPTLVVDAGDGGDHYDQSGKTCVQGCNAFLIDMGGDDRYEAQNLAQGVTTVLGGLSGALFDAAGDDSYEVSPSGTAQGSVRGNVAGSTAVFLDLAGDDHYTSGSQGFLDCGVVSTPPTITLGFGAVGTGCTSSALFLEFAGNDTYQPVGRQGEVPSSLGSSGSLTSDAKVTGKGGGLAAFIDNGGWDTYRGRPDHPGGPDLSDQRNDRLDYQGATRVTTTSAIYAHAAGASSSHGIFWDRDAAGSNGGPGRALDIPGIGVGIGVGGPDLWEHDYAMLVDPAGDDVYRNNAAGTLLRAGAATQPNINTRPSAFSSVSSSEAFSIASVLLDLGGSDHYDGSHTRTFAEWDLDAHEQPVPVDEGTELPAPSTTDAMDRPSRTGALIQGAGFLGVGMLADIGTDDDLFEARGLAQGFGLFGTGILWSQGGDDEFRVPSDVVRNPAVGGDLMAWEEFMPRPLADAETGDSTAAMMTWRPVAAHPHVGGCSFQLLPEGTVGPVRDMDIHLASPQDGTHAAVMSRFTETSGFPHWEARQVDITGTGLDDGGCPAVTTTDRGTLAADAASNQLHPVAGFSGGPANLVFPHGPFYVWQDDRNGEWDLYWNTGATSSGDSDHLVIPGSDQTRPAVSEQYVAYQDDRNAPASPSSIYMVAFSSLNETLVSADAAGDPLPGEHTDPSISNVLVAWQARASEDDPWQVMVHNRLENETRTLAVGGTPGLPPADPAGDHVLASPRVSGSRTVVFTLTSPDGSPSAYRYDWSNDEASLVSDSATAVTVNPSDAGTMAWIDTDAASATERGTRTWEAVWDQSGQPSRQVSVTNSLTHGLLMQGAAWQAGTGLLLSQAGLDAYEARSWAQGAAFSRVQPDTSYPRAECTRMSEGFCVASAPGTRGPPVQHAHAVLLDLDGNDHYRVRSNGQGAHVGGEFAAWSSTAPACVGQPPPICSPVNFGQVVEVTENAGILLDLRGSDRYEAASRSQGIANLVAAVVLTDTEENRNLASNGRPDGIATTNVHPLTSVGVLLDMGGRDGYTYDQESRLDKVPLDTTAAQCSTLTDAVEALWTGPPEDNWTAARDALFADNPLQPAVDLWNDTVRAQWEELNESVQSGGPIMPMWNETRDELRHGEFSQMVEWWGKTSTAPSGGWKSGTYGPWDRAYEENPPPGYPWHNRYPPDYPVEELKQPEPHPAPAYPDGTVRYAYPIEVGSYHRSSDGWNLGNSVWTNGWADRVSNHRPVLQAASDTWMERGPTLIDDLDNLIQTQSDTLEIDEPEDWDQVVQQWQALDALVFDLLANTDLSVPEEVPEDQRDAINEAQGDTRDALQDLTSLDPPETVSQACQTVVDAVDSLNLDAEGLTKVDADGGSRNNHVWTQRIRNPTTVNPGTEPFAVSVGGVGADLPMMDQLSNQLRGFIEASLGVDLKVVKVSQEEELDRASGAVVLRTNITDLDGLADLFQVNLVEVHIDGAFHGYADRNESASEGSQDVEVWDLQWDTDIPAWPDSNYSVQSIVRYGVADHPELGNLGSVDNTRNVTVDNPPRIHDVGVSTPAFSPINASFAQATSAHPTVHFTTSLDPGIDGGDAWATIQVFDATGNTLIDTLATDTLVVGDDGGARAQWDGRYGDNNSIVPPGDYRIHVTATDNLSDDDRIRVAPHVPVRVVSDPPRDGCVRFLSSERTCHDPSISVGEAAAQGTGDTRIVPLVLTVPAGAEVERVYVFESIPSSGGTWGDWQLTDTHNVGTSLTEVDHALPLTHNTTKRVLVLFEDPFGNVECVPWCGATHNDLDDVPSSGDLLDAAERKASGDEYSEFFADYGRPETEMVSDANAQAILYRINGEDLGPGVTPRVGPNDTIEMFLLGSDSTSDLSKTKLLWRHGNDKPTDPDLEAPGFVMECIESPCPPGDVLFRWDAWGSLLAEREWPEGDLLWKFDVRDQAGNAPVSGIAGAVLFDKTAPHLADSEDFPVVVEYGGGGTSVQSEDETVSITVRIIDPTIGLAFSDWKKFTVLLNASAITQSADDTSLLPMKPHASSPDRFDVTFPVDHPDLNDSVLAESGWLERLPLHLADEAGNWNNQSAVEVALGQPQLGLQRVNETVGVHNATLRWTSEEEANVTLHITNATGHTFLPIHSPFGTVHDFVSIPVEPASLYTYQIEAVDQDGLRDVAGPFTLHSLAGLDGAIDAPADGAILSGVAPLHGSFQVESDPLPEARVQVRAFNDSLLGGSRLLMDEVVRSSGQTQDTLRTFSKDMVTSALPDGEYRLEVLLTYQSPVMEEVKLLQVTDLLVDNSAPVLEPLAPETGDVLDTSPDAITFHATDDWTDILPATTTLRINGHMVEDIVASATTTDDPQDATVRIQLPPDAVPTGTLRFTITVQDAAGNLGVTSYTLSYDPDAPRAVGTDDPVQVRYPEGQTAAKPGDLVQVYARLGDATGIDSVWLDASPLGGDDAVSLQSDATGHVTTLRVGDDVPAGETILEILAEDDLGHQATFPVTVQVERSPPALAGSDPVPTSMHSARLGIALDKEARSVWVDLYDDGEQLLTRVPALPDDLAAFPALAGAVGVHGYAADLDGLGPGDRYQVAVEVIGPAGHNASHQRDWRFAPVVVDAPDLEGLSAQTMRDGRVQLEWSTLQDIPDDAVKYIVYRASSDAGFEPVVSTWATHHQDQPTTGATHRYFVQAENLDGMLGSATPITDVFVPKPAAVTAWEVTPSRGVEGTPFRFTATVQGTGSAAPVAWVVLEGDPYRMALQSGDCRDECTFTTTIHAPVAFRTLEQRFHVEVTDGDMQLRGPREGEAPGPRVLLGSDGLDTDGDVEPSHGAPSVAPMTLIALLVAAAVLMRRRPRP